MMQNRLNKALPYLTAAFILLMIGSVYRGWLDPFFFGAEHANVKGIDFFAVPKSYLNLLEGRSAFDTWGGAPYGPYATWYLAHPAFSVFVASWFSFFSPWTAFWLFLFFSLALMILSARLIAATSENAAAKRIAYAVLLMAFPTYWLLYSGNMHAPLVLALAMVLAGLHSITYDDIRRGKKLLFAGLLISFFSKPVVILMIPVLLLLKETRATTVKSLVIYAGVSFLFLVIPALNPQGVGLSEVIRIASDPSFIKAHMNIYQNNFVLNEYMKDNSIHWLNLIAQSDYKLQHIDVFSLPVFMDNLTGKVTAAGLYKIPLLVSLLFSVLVPFIADRRKRLEAALLLIMSISLTFFLSYNTVWEYQFTSALPVVAILYSLKERNVFYAKRLRLLFLAGLFFCLPSFYFLVRGGDFNSSTSLTIIRLDRVLPALFIYLIMTWELAVEIKKQADLSVLRKYFKDPDMLFD